LHYSGELTKFAPYFDNMKKRLFIPIIAVFVLASCGEYNKLAKSTDYEYKYEAAKEYFAEGSFNKASVLLEELITFMKGTDKAEESLYMLAMSYYNDGDFQSASTTFNTYVSTYPRGTYAEYARFYSGKALYNDTPEARLDQTSTTNAIQTLQNFLEFYPNSRLKGQAQEMIYALQDKLVEKEYFSAKQYYNMGDYFGNCAYGGNNYQAAIITAENALKDYPYSKYREDLSLLVLRSKYNMARQSIDTKITERFRDAIDEYYGFKNEFPESKHLKEAEKIFEESSKKIK